MEILRADHAGERCRQALVQPLRPYQSMAAQGLPADRGRRARAQPRSEEHTSELQSLRHLVCRLLLEKKKKDASLAGISRARSEEQTNALFSCKFLVCSS